MKNKAFTKLSPHERQQKLLGAIDRKTAELLLPSELLAITDNLSLRQQYTIRFYRNSADYWRALSLDRHIRIRSILAPASPLDAAAVITWSTKDPTGTRQLHIFIPPSRLRKGRKPYEQKRISAAHRA